MTIDISSTCIHFYFVFYADLLRLTPDGALFEEGQYAHGLPNGEWRRFHPGGTLSERSSFAAGRLVGAAERFDERGNALTS